MGQALVHIEGVDSLLKSFKILPKETNKVIRRTMTAAIAEVRKDARSRVDDADEEFIRYYRSIDRYVVIKPGTLRKAIKSRAVRDKRNKNKFIGQLFITEGSRDEKDAFHWRFREFGTRFSPAQPFIRPAAKKAENNIERVMSRAMDKVIKKVINSRKAG